MSTTLKVSQAHSLGGVSFPESRSLTADGFIVHDVSVAAAQAGALTTRTDDDTGVVTMDDSTHTIALSDRVDVYWTGGKRRGMAVTDVTDSAVTINAGSGDNLPTEDTELVLSVPEELDVAVAGAQVVGLLAYIAAPGQVVFAASGAAEIATWSIGDTVSRIWHNEDGTDNPVTGSTIETVYVSHSDEAAATARIGVLYDNI